MLDLILRNVNLPDGRRGIDIGIRGERIVELKPSLNESAQRELALDQRLVSPAFVDAHFHLDAALSYGRPRVNQSGTLLEGIALWGELKPTLDHDEIKTRALALCRWAIANGNLAIRSHVDVCDPALTAVEALLAVREEIKPYLDLQLVAFPQDGLLRSPGAEPLLLQALDKGVQVVGGIPHFERTQAEGAASVRRLCEIAAERGLPVDMHCDESDDPQSRHVETLAFETQRLGLQGRATGSHLTSMHSMDNYYAAKLLPLLAEADLQVVANPLINITLQGRLDSYPKRRGMTRVKELLAHGVNLALGHDCVMDPWYSLGSHDMLDVAHMGIHVAQMTGQDEMQAMFDAVTVNAARVLELPDYGLRPGCYADLVVLAAADPIEALRLRPTRLQVIRRGRIIAASAAPATEVYLHGQTHSVDFTLA